MVQSVVEFRCKSLRLVGRKLRARLLFQGIIFRGEVAAVNAAYGQFSRFAVAVGGKVDFSADDVIVGVQRDKAAVGIVLAVQPRRFDAVERIGGKNDVVLAERGKVGAACQKLAVPAGTDLGKSFQLIIIYTIII